VDNLKLFWESHVILLYKREFFANNHKGNISIIINYYVKIRAYQFRQKNQDGNRFEGFFLKVYYTIFCHIGME